MNARLAVAGSVMAGLVAVGGVAVASTWQPTPARQSVEFVQPAAEVSTPTATDTPSPTSTVAPVVVPTTVAPVPVESTQAPVVVAPKPEVIVPKVVQPAAPSPTEPTQPRPIVTGSNGYPLPPPNIPAENIPANPPNVVSSPEPNQ